MRSATNLHTSLGDVHRPSETVDRDWPPRYTRAQKVAVLEVATPEVATPEFAAQEVATQEVATPEVATQEFAAPEVATPEVATQEVAGKPIYAPNGVIANVLVSSIGFEQPLWAVR